MLASKAMAAVVLLSAFLTFHAASAQSPAEEIAPLPTTLSAEQLESLLQLKSGATPEVVASQPHARRRLPRPVLELTPEEASYKLAVQKLGVDTHRFVHCDLPYGRVRTGVITEVREQGFVLKDGILDSQWISYTELQAAPRPVPAIGTRIGQGFKWVGLGLGMVAVIPLIPFAFLFWDGC